MAPKAKTVTKGVKRAAGDDASKTAAKQLRVDPTVHAVQEVVEQVEGLNESCKAMLLATLPSSLCVPMDERVPLQARVVEMIAEVIEMHRSSLKAAIDIELAKVAELESSKSKLEEDFAKADEAHKNTIDVVSGKKLAAQEAEQASKEASSSLKEAKAAQAAGDAQIAKIEAERQELQDALEKCLPNLCGEGFQTDAATKHRDAVMDVLKRSAQAFESTLLMTLPTALIKPPAERGDFDKMAIGTLQKNLGDYVEKLDGELRVAKETKTTQAVVLEAAAAQNVAAREQFLAAQKVVASAEETQTTAAGQLETTKTAKNDFEPSLESAVAQRDAKQAALTHFEEHNVKSFTSLEKITATVVEGSGKTGGA